MSYYGVAYRPSPQRGGGFQSPTRRSPDRRPLKPYRPLRTPSPSPGRTPFRFGGAKAPAKAFGKRGMANAVARAGWKLPFRAWPGLGWGLLVADLIPWSVFQPETDIHSILASAGYSQCCTLGIPPNTWQVVPGNTCRAPGDQCNMAAGCGLIGQVPGGDIATDPIHFNASGQCTVNTDRRTRQLLLGIRTGTTPSRHTIVETWAWQAPNRNSIPALDLPLPTPAVIPQYDLPPLPYFTPFPDDAPIGVPVPFPRHIPFPRIPKVPKRSPWPQGREQRQPRYVRPPRVGPRGDPGAEPGVEITPRPGGRPAPAHEYKPPKPNEREKKGACLRGPKP